MHHVGDINCQTLKKKDSFWNNIPPGKCDPYVYDEGLQLYLNMYDEIKNNELINVELSDEQKEEIKDNGY